MMYKTHVEVGKNFYWLSLPLMIKLGFIPNVADVVSNGGSSFEVGATAIMSAAYMYVGYRGTKFGAGFPDLDMEGSVPDKKNPLLGKTLRAFGVKHRGKFSHSFDSMTIFYSVIYLLMMSVVPDLLLENEWFLGLPDWLGGQFLKGGVVNSMILTYIAFAYVGTLSHLVADLPTGGGVRVFFWGKKFRLKSKFFRTGEDSLWEMFCRKSAKILQPISIIVSIMMFCSKVV